ncbi:hypothetical protein LE190_00915 [Massilia oculi]|uniref:Uncharacterized protein n=1 Tax=Massilia hydrophila TaxID=3044279 RepID=A0ABS7Y495_9BURK|nr:hypothetical protein [Massilia oculi]MCA1854489.1 hypothetical protein [Massilia oculi]
MASVDADALENAMILADPPHAGRAWVCPATGAIHLRADMVGSHEALPDDIHEAGRYIPVPGAARLGLGRALVFDFVRRHMPGDEAEVRALLRGPGGFERFAKLAQARGLLASWHAFRQERTAAALRAWCEENGLVLRA